MFINEVIYNDIAVSEIILSTILNFTISIYIFFYYYFLVLINFFAFINRFMLPLYELKIEHKYFSNSYSLYSMSPANMICVIVIRCEILSF